MAYANPRSTATIAGHPVHAALVPFPIACFTLALLTDIAFWRTADLFWQNMSAWLLFVGLIAGGLAALAGMIDLLARREVRARRPAWPHAIGNALVLVLAFFNSLLHARDGWTAVVPWGLVLSGATVLVLFVTVWLGRAMVFNHGVGVQIHDRT